MNKRVQEVRPYRTSAPANDVRVFVFELNDAGFRVVALAIEDTVPAETMIYLVVEPTDDLVRQVVFTFYGRPLHEELPARVAELNRDGFAVTALDVKIYPDNSCICCIAERA